MMESKFHRGRIHCTRATGVPKDMDPRIPTDPRNSELTVSGLH